MAEIRGLEEVLRKFSELPDGIGVKGRGPLDDAMRAGANVWRDEAKRIASGVGPGKKSGRTAKIGRLKDNISTVRDPDPESNGFTHRYSVSYGKAFWGRFVELGSEVFKDGRDYSKTPFLRPAFDNTQKQVLDKISDQLAKQIERIVE